MARTHDRVHQAEILPSVGRPVGRRVEPRDAVARACLEGLDLGVEETVDRLLLLRTPSGVARVGVARVGVARRSAARAGSRARARRSAHQEVRGGGARTLLAEAMKGAPLGRPFFPRVFM